MSGCPVYSEDIFFFLSLLVQEYKGGDFTWLTDPLATFLPSEAIPQLVTNALLLEGFYTGRDEASLRSSI